MADVALDDEFDEKQGEQDTDGWVYQEQKVCFVGEETGCQKVLYLLNECFKDYGNYSCDKTHNQTHRNEYLLVGVCSFYPFGHGIEYG